MNKIRRFKHIIIISLIVVFSATIYSFKDNFFEISKNIELFASIYKELNVYYVDEIKPGELMKKGIDEMLSSLDPYTTYITESEIEDFKFMTTGQYGGIGAVIRKKSDYIVVTEPYENLPADKAGLKPGDIILSVDGVSTNNKTTSEISSLLKGQPKTKVSVLIKREGEKDNLKLDILREEIKINSVMYSGIIDDNIGYIYLTNFPENAGEEVKKALTELKEKYTLKGVILDLRNNPGGLLSEAVNVSNIFIDKGNEIVSTKGRVKDWDQTHNTTSQAVDTKIPLAVIVNSGSASASEIVAGAIQDYDRGVVIGERTFGKGLVQTTRPLAYNARLKITTAKYYIPSGRCIQALDYSHRNADGSVGKIPDSLISEFKTKKGRIVYDGGGINPDMKIKDAEYSKIVSELYVNDYCFDFATQFKLKNKNIPSAKDFKITDDVYEEFINFVVSKNFKYTSDTEEQLQALKKTAEEEKMFKDIESEYNLIINKINKEKVRTNLLEFKEDISKLLKSEILIRYYYHRGQIEGMLKDDAEIIEAVKILNNQTQYNSTLNDIEKYNSEVKKIKK